MPNRSLDDFLGGDDVEDATEEPAEPTEPASDADEEPAADATDSETAETADPAEDADDEPTLTVEEAQPTYDFSPDGAACAACGETVETRWHDPEVGMVCADCKGW